MENQENANVKNEINESFENILNENNELSKKSEKDFQTEIETLKDQLLRSLAEVDNVRKRSEKQVEEASKYAISGFIKDMISVIENLYRTVENININDLEGNPALKTVKEGLDMIIKELTNTLDRNGIKRILPNIGDKFDHNLHQAVMHIDSPKEPGTIIQILQSGYILRDRLLSPAMVGVVKQ